MGVGAGLYMYVVVLQKFTFTISSPDEFLLANAIARPSVVCLECWTLRLQDISPTRHFAYDMDTSPIGHFAYWTVRLRDISPTGQFAHSM